MLKQLCSLLLVCSVLISTAAEKFDHLNPLPEARQERIRKSGWTLSASPALPSGWSFLPGKDCRYDVLQSKERGNFILVKGMLMTDHQSLQRLPTDDTVRAEFLAKSPVSGGKGMFLVSFAGDKGKFLGSQSRSINLTSDWQKYKIDLKLSHRLKNQDVKMVCPVVKSDTGMHLDDFSVICCRRLPALPKAQAVPAEFLAMDFDLTGLNGRKQLKDRTGKFTLYSDCGSFLEEHGALRVAYGARFRIPCENKDFGNCFTISAWILKSRLQYYFRTPIINRGYSRPPMRLNYRVNPDEYDFEIDLNAGVPGFVTKRGGIHTTGWGALGEYRYLNRDHQIFPPEEIFEFDKWMHLGASYDNGHIRLYLNGILTGEADQPDSSPLMTSSLPLHIGGTRVKGENDNKDSGEFLIRSLKIFSKALSPEEIAWEATVLPPGISRGETHSLQSIRNYYPEEMKPCDPELARRLKQTEKFAAAMPADPYRNKKHMSSRITGDGQRTLDMEISGRKITPVSVNPTYWDGVPRRSGEAILDFAAAGVDLVKMGFSLRDVWKGPDQHDLSSLNKFMDLTLQNNPRAAVYISIGMHPPAWFIRDHAEELEEYYLDKNRPELGKKKFTASCPLASDLWLKMSGNILRKIIQELEHGKYRSHIFGYAFSGGDSGEWYWPGQWSGIGTFTGYSRTTEKCFRTFIRKKYRSDLQALRRSWNQPALTFENVRIPSPAQRLAGENFQFRDPEKTGACLDLREFIQHRTYLSITETARAIKESLPVQKIVLTYYGYPLHYTWHSSILHVSGHQMTGEVLRSPWLDAIATPIDYFHRRGGEPGTNIAGYSGTAYLNRKMLCCEQDLRTHLFPRLEHGRTSSLQETLDVIRRGYLYTIADNYWFWYVFQAGNHCFHQDGIMEEVSRLSRITEQTVRRSRKDISEVALIFDEKDSLNMMAAYTRSEAEMMFMYDHTQLAFENAHQMGAPFKLYFTDDLNNPRMPDYKLYIFLNQYSVSPEQMKIINAKVRKNNAVSVWCYAPGYFSRRRNSLKNMTALTGFTFKEERREIKMKGNLEILRKRPFTEKLRPLPEYIVGPLFQVWDSQAEILAKWQNMNVLALKEFASWRSVYTFVPLTREMLTGLCRYAGVHLFSDSGDTLLVNQDYIGIHAAAPGNKIIRLKQKARVRELIGNRNLGLTDKIKDHLDRRGDTRIYEINNLKDKSSQEFSRKELK